MSSNNYALHANSTKIEILDGIRQHKIFHFEITPANDICWGKGGQDIDRLECTNSFVDIHDAQMLFEMASEMDGVSFGNGYHGWCFQIGKFYFWLTPVTKEHLLTPSQREFVHRQPTKEAAPFESL